MAGKVRIDQERCKGCGLCVEVCPNGCLRIGETANQAGYLTAEAELDGCSGCCACAIVCPDAAIEVYRVTCNSRGGKALHATRDRRSDGCS